MKTIDSVKAFGLTAVLWHQGESDKQSSYESYKSNLENLIQNTQTAENPIPWLVAIASFSDDNISEEVRNAQAKVVNASDSVFFGPDTDTIGLELRNTGDKVHFNREDTFHAARLWVQSIESFLNDQKASRY